MASPTKATFASSFRSVREVAKGRRVRRIVLILFIVLAVFGLLGFFAAPPLIRHVAGQQLSEQLGRPASIGRIALNPYTLRLEADHVHVGERGGNGDFVDIERLILRTSWSSLFRLAPVIDEVQVDSPRFTIVRYDAQHFNFTDLIEKFSKAPSQPDSKPAQFSVSNIRLENGKITFDDRLLGVTHVVDQWRLGIPFIATLPSKTDIFVEPLLRARIDGSPLAIDGRTKPFSKSRESEIALRFDGLDVPKLASYAPSGLPVTVKAGKLSSDIKVTFAMTDDAPILRITGTTDLADVDVLDEHKAPLFAARALHVSAASLEPLKNLYHFQDIRIDAPAVHLARGKDGTLSMQHTFAPAAGAKAAAAASAASTAAARTAKAPPPLDLVIGNLALADGTLDFEDQAASRPVSAGLTHVGLRLAGFSTLAKSPARYEFATGVKNQPQTALAIAGTLSFAARTADAKIDLKSASLPFLQPYLDSVTAAKVLDGSLSLQSTVTANWSKQPADVQIGASALDLQSLKLAAAGTAQPAVAIGEGKANVTHVDLAGRNAQIANIELARVAVDAQRTKDGAIDLAALAAPPREAVRERTVIHAAKKAQEEGPAWRYSIGELSVKDSSAAFTDQTNARPVKIAVAPLQLRVRQISQDLGHALPVELQATVNGKGTLGVTGDVTATPLKLALKVTANRLDAAAFEPYFGNKLNASIASALLNATGDIALAQPDKAKGVRASYRGDAALVDVRMIDKATSDRFAGWRSLALTGLKADYDERGTNIDAAKVTFSNFYGRVLLDAQGKLNLRDVVAHETGAPQSLTRDQRGANSEPVPLSPPAASDAQAAAAASGASAPAATTAHGAVTAATPSQSPVRLHFGQLVLQNGRVNYTDNFIKPNYSASLIAIQGTVGAFGTESTQPAPVDVSAKLAANGPIAIRGNVNPLIAKPALDLTATAHGIELTNLTPYSAKYAGYPITKGKLNVDLHYQLANDQLTADNHIFIDQLTFGDHVENDTATKLPVKLAISLLKNSRGEIDVDIPVSGSLANPKFSIGGLIWRAVLNLLQKAVTAPFSLLAHAFGGNGEELGYVEFDAGSAVLSDAAQKKLDTIAKVLADKPSIRIEVTGRADPAVDEPGLRAAYVDRLVRQQKIRDMVGNGESVDTSSVKVDSKDYDKYLTKAYKDADFKKPRNIVGLTKTLPDDDMKAALAAHAVITDTSMRDLAQRRAQAVQQYFDGKIDNSRVFIVAPKLDAHGISDKGATTRVDFGLK